MGTRKRVLFTAVGFTLLEVMIALAIIMVLSSIAVPYFLAARQQAYESAAAAFLRSLHSAQEVYRASHQEYASQFADVDLKGQRGGGGKAKRKGKGRCRGKGKGKGKGKGACDVIVTLGYIFTLDRPRAEEWSCTAEPLRSRGDIRYFYTDNTGMIRSVRGKLADETSPPL